MAVIGVILLIILLILISAFKEIILLIILLYLSWRIIYFGANNVLNSKIVSGVFIIIFGASLAVFLLYQLLLPLFVGDGENKIKNKNNLLKSKKDLNSLSGIEFEKYCCNVLKYRGFTKIQQTPASGDYGVDIIAYKSNYKYAIQCKRFNSKVGNKAVQEVYSGKGYYNCSKAMVISNSTYTQSAKNTAEKLDVELVTL